jgi:hypothetical protein
LGVHLFFDSADGALAGNGGWTGLSVPEIHRCWSEGCVDRGFAVVCREDSVVSRALYRLARLIVDLLVLRDRRDRSKDAEILVLRVGCENSITLLTWEFTGASAIDD